MRRTIAGFSRDESGDWVARLDCLHRQHVRHQPPFRNVPWVEDDHGREQRVGTELDCPLCDRCELPDGLEIVRTTPTWDQHAMPGALRNDHRVAPGRWGRIRVEQGTLRFVAKTNPQTDVIVDCARAQAIPPEIEHHVEPGDDVRFSIEFLAASED